MKTAIQDIDVHFPQAGPDADPFVFATSEDASAAVQAVIAAFLPSFLLPFGLDQPRFKVMSIGVGWVVTDESGQYVWCDDLQWFDLGDLKD